MSVKTKSLLLQQAVLRYQEAAEWWGRAGEYTIKSKPNSHLAGDCYTAAADCARRAANLLRDDAEVAMKEISALVEDQKFGRDTDPISLRLKTASKKRCRINVKNDADNRTLSAIGES